MNKQIESIVNFNVLNAVNDYSKFLENEQAEHVMNNIILNYSENIGRIVQYAPKSVSDDELLKILRLYSSRMSSLWTELRKLHSETYFEFNLDNPFYDEVAKTDLKLAHQLFK